MLFERVACPFVSVTHNVILYVPANVYDVWTLGPVASSQELSPSRSQLNVPELSVVVRVTGSLVNGLSGEAVNHSGSSARAVVAVASTSARTAAAIGSRSRLAEALMKPLPVVNCDRSPVGAVRSLTRRTLQGNSSRPGQPADAGLSRRASGAGSRRRSSRRRRR